jgi:hypothetical protein
MKEKIITLSLIPISHQGQDVFLPGSFSYACPTQGVFPYTTDCSKFWLCDYQGCQGQLVAQLYLCPDGYWFDEVKECCHVMDQVSCNKKEVLFPILPPAKQLQVSCSKMFDFKQLRSQHLG